MLERFERDVLWIGLEKEDYLQIRPKIRQHNRSIAILLSGCATLLIAAMFIITFFVPGVASNRIVYRAGMFLSLGVFLAGSMLSDVRPWLVVILVYVSYFIFYVYGIFIGTITDPSQKTVTFIVMLVFLPILFIDRPLNQMITTAIYVTIFVCLCLKNKTGAVLQNDIIDAIIFGTLGIISGFISNHSKVRSYILEYNLQELGQFDQLTKMNNRNAYELNLKRIPEHAERSLCCIYIDVNGLHELNNARGHSSGDKMLKYVAGQIKLYFGNEYTFRIGGDEFVVFVLDSNKDSLTRSLSSMVSSIEDAGYFVATGLEFAEVEQLSLDTLIKSAESKMYRDKKEFYKNRVHNRRRE